MKRRHNTQILIAGAGPAGLMLAVACAEVGLSVVLADQNLHQVWPRRYGVWAQDLAPMNLDSVFGHSWKNASVWLDKARQHTWESSYGCLDNRRTAEVLLERFQRAGGESLAANVVSLDKRSDLVLVEVEGGFRFAASLFVDATGAGRWVKRSGGADAFQTAYGALVETEGHGMNLDTATWMDFRDPSPQARPLSGDIPSFLYAMPFSPTRCFVEETVLISKPEVPVPILKERLRLRLEDRGIHVLEILEEEFCRIPMNLPIPDLRSGIFGFGAAASMVHPATGYSVAFAARMAPLLAHALRENIEMWTKCPDMLAKSMWSVLWSAERLRAEALYRFGADVLATFDADQLRDFFDAFFRTPESSWRGYLSRGLTPWEVGGVMWKVHAECAPAIKRELYKAVLKDPGSIARGWLNMGSSGTRKSRTRR